MDSQKLSLREAFEIAQRELEWVRGSHRVQEQRMAKLRAENQRLREALRFYADISGSVELLNDHGMTAQAALEPEEE